jgi:hypothetical protein
MFQGMRFLVSTASYQNALAVTPSDDDALDRTATALYIGSSGDVKVDLENSGEAIIFKSVPVGFLPARVTKVYSTGTDASSIIALW